MSFRILIGENSDFLPFQTPGQNLTFLEILGIAIVRFILYTFVYSFTFHVGFIGLYLVQ